MLGFSSQIQRLVSTFMTYRNDIDIYTEDEEKDKEFYRSLLKKLVPTSIRINDVTPLGSKRNVLDRCQKELPNGRKKLFIVDGDINLINEKTVYTLPNLYVHDAYCIENLLIDRESVLKFIYMQCAVKSEEEIEQLVDYENWLSAYSKELINLFLHFAIADLFNLPFTLGNAYQFHKKNGDDFIFDEDATKLEIDKLKRYIIDKVAQSDYERELTRLKATWAFNENNFLKAVSGKDYLFPILLLKAMSFKKSKSKPSLEEMKISLVNFSSLNKFSRLRDVLVAI